MKFINMNVSDEQKAFFTSRVFDAQIAFSTARASDNDANPMSIDGPLKPSKKASNDKPHGNYVNKTGGGGDGDFGDYGL